MCQEITIFAKFSYTFVFSILDFDFNFKPLDFELIAFFNFIKYPPGHSYGKGTRLHIWNETYFSMNLILCAVAEEKDEEEDAWLRCCLFGSSHSSSCLCLSALTWSESHSLEREKPLTQLQRRLPLWQIYNLLSGASAHQMMLVSI